jgi:hypothetical protein
VELKELNIVEYKILVAKDTVAKAIEIRILYFRIINLSLMEKKDG